MRSEPLRSLIRRDDMVIFLETFFECGSVTKFKKNSWIFFIIFSRLPDYSFKKKKITFVDMLPNQQKKVCLPVFSIDIFIFILL